ncbi:MAG: DUF427 domain-containing protein [Acidobacteriota bacterium]
MQKPPPDPPGPGQVSVWDFPRPPRLERVRARIRVAFAGQVIADTTNALRVCETASPPTYYIPPGDIVTGVLVEAAGRSVCEWKGRARYWSVRVGDREAPQAAWSYPTPTPAFALLRDYVAFYAGRVDACWVGDVRVTPQEGDFYGGWITPDLAGPFKGPPGTEHW